MFIEPKIHPALAAHPKGIPTLCAYIDAQGRFFRRAAEVGHGTLLGDAVEAALAFRDAKRDLYNLLEEIRSAVERQEAAPGGTEGSDAWARAVSGEIGPPAASQEAGSCDHILGEDQ